MSINALGSNNYVQDLYAKNMKPHKEAEKPVEKKTESAVTAKEISNIAKQNEDNLSEKAQDLLKKLREKYGDYDFFVANTTEEQDKLANSGSKEFSVMISADELEKMADSDDYANEKMSEIEKSVEMCKRICEQYGYASEGDETEDSIGVINKISVAIGDDGSMRIFAEVEKLSEKQKERIEKAKEDKAEEKKAEEKKSEKAEAEEKLKNLYGKDNKDSVKRVTIEASSEEDLIAQLKSINWKSVSESFSGDKFDFSV